MTAITNSYYPQVVTPTVMPSELTVTQDITLAAVLVGTLTGVACQAITTLLPLTTEIKLVSSKST